MLPADTGTYTSAVISRSTMRKHFVLLVREEFSSMFPDLSYTHSLHKHVG